jgi:hypothetical protein
MTGQFLAGILRSPASACLAIAWQAQADAKSRQVGAARCRLNTCVAPGVGKAYF